MPSAHIILYTLAAVIGFWGASLFLRALADRVGAIASRMPLARSRITPRRLTRAQRRAGLIGGLLLLPVAATAAYLGTVVQRWSGQIWPTRGETLWTLISWSFALFAVAALYVAWQFDPSRGRRRCCKCWYDMVGAPTLRCPECGHEMQHQRDLLRTRRNGSMVFVALLLLLIACGVYRIPTIKQYGWTGAVPTTILIFGLEWLPEELIDSPVVWPSRTSATGSLQERVEGSLLWDWQTAWLHRKCLAILAHSESLRAIDRASTIYPRNFVIASRDSANGGATAGNSAAHQALIALAHLSSPDLATRRRASKVLAESYFVFDSQADASINAQMPTLLAALADPDDQVAIQTAACLNGRSAIDIDAILPTLRDQVIAKTSSAQRRRIFLWHLASLSATYPTANAMILGLTREDDDAIRAPAVQAYVGANRHRAETWADAREWMTSGSDAVCSAAATGLGGIHDPPDWLKPLVLRQLHNRPGARFGLLWALLQDVQLREDSAIPDIIAALSDPGLNVCTAAAQLLGEMNATAALPALQKISDDSKADLRLVNAANIARSRIAPPPDAPPDKDPP